MVTTITLPSSALGFSLDSNNQYKISVTLVMKEIIKLIKDLSVNSYLKHHKIKYRYSFYINDNHVQYLYSPSYHGHLEGKNGYIAVISPKDRLPDESVTVKYKLN